MNQLLERVTQDQSLQSRLLQFSQYQGEVSLHVQRDQLLPLMETLKSQYGFDYLVDVGTVDHYTDEGRYEVFYNIFNLEQKVRLRVKVRLEEDDAVVPSVTGIWPAANWNEREAFDMMGIRFDGHPDLRRMFMPEDFQYAPMRKEFPLIGIPGSIQMPEKDGPKEYR